MTDGTTCHQSHAMEMPPPDPQSGSFCRLIRRQLWLNYRYNRAFYCCQWRWPFSWFVFLRLVLAVYSLYAIIHNLAVSDPIILLYHHWAYGILTLHLVWAAVLALTFYRKGNEGLMLENKKDPCKVHLIVQSQQTTVTGVCKDGKFEGDTQVNVVTKTITGTYTISPGELAPIASTSTGKISQFSYNENAKTDKPKEETGKQNVTFGKTTTAGPGSENVAAASNAAADCPTCPYRNSECQQRPKTVVIMAVQGVSPFSLQMQSTPWYFKLSWLLSNIASATAPVQTLACFIYYVSNGGVLDLSLQVMNLQVLNLAFVFVDQMISARPVRLLHAYQPMIYGLIFVIYSLSTGYHNSAYMIFRHLDWAVPETAIRYSAILVAVLIPTSHVLWFVLYCIKIYIFFLMNF